MKTDLFSYDLPPELIAQTPLAQRSGSRLLVYDRSTRRIEHRIFADIVDLIPPGDLLVLNRSRVLPARLLFPLPPHGNQGEILFLSRLDAQHCQAMVRPGRRFREGACHELPENLGTVTVERVLADGLRVLRFDGPPEVLELFRRFGQMPLPPYITSRESEPDQYQTVFSREEGSVAAPTAGLHFDESLLAALRARGVRIGEVVLHVGLGTFKPIETEEVEDHIMHAERFHIDVSLARLFAEVRQQGGKVWACGTTSIRSLESAIQADGELQTGWQETACYLRPGHVFRAVDRMLTNFHLPRSTLLVLVAAFCGLETTLALYREAVACRYRFFSFGDAMALV